MKRFLDRGLMTPVFLHFFAWMMGQESDSPGWVLVCSLTATFCTGLLAGAAFPPPAGLLASLWVPAAMSAYSMHWAMGSVSPHGPAKALLMGGAWDASGGRVSHVLVSAAAAASGCWIAWSSPNTRKALNSFSWRDLADD